MRQQLPPQPPDLRRLLEPMVRSGVDFVLIGGVAGILHGSNYPTYDLDLVYDRRPENVARLVRALREIGNIRLRGAPADLEFPLDERMIENGANFTFITPHGDLDLLGDVAGAKGYDALAEDAVEREVFGMTVRVASLDKLIATKRAANRPKDRNMVEEYLVLSDERRAEEIED